MKALETYTCICNTLLYLIPITFENVEISPAYDLSNALSVKYMVHAFCSVFLLHFDFNSLEEATAKLILINTSNVFHRVATKVFISS